VFVLIYALFGGKKKEKNDMLLNDLRFLKFGNIGGERH